MHTLSGSITADGPLVEVLVGLAAADAQTLLAAGSPVPPPVQMRALIDTGAEVTALDPSALSALQAAGIPPARILVANSPALGERDRPRNTPSVSPSSIRSVRPGPT